MSAVGVHRIHCCDHNPLYLDIYYRSTDYLVKSTNLSAAVDFGHVPRKKGRELCPARVHLVWKLKVDTQQLILSAQNVTHKGVIHLIAGKHAQILYYFQSTIYQSRTQRVFTSHQFSSNIVNFKNLLVQTSKISTEDLGMIYFKKPQVVLNFN
jgi:hypothetical protein